MAEWTYCAHLYDANGNVTQVVNLAADPKDPNTALVAKYEYDPYGNNLLDPNDPNESGTFAATNPFRFSTKYFDVETGLAYFGGRYYHASLGRWLNRDPIGELGGANLYAYALNDPIAHIDPLGHAVCVPGWHGCPGGQRPDDGRCPKKGQRPAGATSQPPDPAICATLHGPCTTGWELTPDGGCRCSSDSLFTYWWEWIPIIGTIGHAITPIPGGDIPEHYSLCQPSAKDCKEDSASAVEACEKCVSREALGYYGQVLGVPTLGKDIGAAGAGLVMDTKAIINLLARKGGVKLLGGGLILTADGLADLGIMLNKLDTIRDAAKEGKQRFCTCAGKE